MRVRSGRVDGNCSSTPNPSTPQIKADSPLEALAPLAEIVWQTVSELIELKQSKPYDQAVARLVDLRDLAEYQGTLEAFNSRLQQLQQQYRSRSGLLNRLYDAGLLTR
jgi:hypothetical protein